MEAATHYALAGSKLALNYARTHRVQTAVAATSLALTPILGPGWIVALPLKAVGFGAGGVAGDSLAAAAQSGFYGGYVPAGSVFAGLQNSGGDDGDLSLEVGSGWMEQGCGDSGSRQYNFCSIRREEIRGI